jgi:hypothetical protein
MGNDVVEDGLGRVLSNDAAEGEWGGRRIISIETI